MGRGDSARLVIVISSITASGHEPGRYSVAGSLVALTQCERSIEKIQHAAREARRK